MLSYLICSTVYTLRAARLIFLNAVDLCVYLSLSHFLPFVRSSNGIYVCSCCLNVVVVCCEENRKIWFGFRLFFDYSIHNFFFAWSVSFSKAHTIISFYDDWSSSHAFSLTLSLVQFQLHSFLRLVRNERSTNWDCESWWRWVHSDCILIFLQCFIPFFINIS